MSEANSDLGRWLQSTEWAAATTPVLSILVPTYDHDVVPLCRELLADMATLPAGAVELLVLIDGNPALAGQESMITEANRLGLPAALALSAANLGRSMARNRLARMARGRFLHFLDADSLPDAPGFVGRTLAALRDGGSRDDLVLCGGRTGKRLGAPPSDARLFALHSQRREWISADQRNLDPCGNFLSANFVVPRALFFDMPFDEQFSGWGWEDTEWALRVASRGKIMHIDNTVSHMEHHKDAVWLSRIDRAAVNYIRLYQLHAEAVGRHRIFPLIRALQPLRGLPPLAALLRCLAVSTLLPPGIRLIFLKQFQALRYGAAMNRYFG